MLQTLRRAGGSLVMTIPRAFVAENGLSDGSRLELTVEGSTLVVKTPSRPKYKLADLLAETGEALPRVDGWDDSPAVGTESL